MTTPSSLRCRAFSILMVNGGAGRTGAVVNAGFLRDRCPQPCVFEMERCRRFSGRRKERLGTGPDYETP